MKQCCSWALWFLLDKTNKTTQDFVAQDLYKHVSIFTTSKRVTAVNASYLKNNEKKWERFKTF